MSATRPSIQKRRSGFALLITITLLAFLVLLLVSLAALTRVETRVASNNQQLSQARQNALMGLNIALGRLQSLAGSDQRVTATADLVVGVHNDKRRWTGVWKTTDATPSPEWLVSTALPDATVGAASVASALPAVGVVTLVGDNTVDVSTSGNAVAVETQPIVTDTVPGLTGPQTIGNFAYWVGDEGVKASVSLVDPWKNPTEATLDATIPQTTPAQARAYGFVNIQRTGIEGVDTSSVGTPLSVHYPAGSDALIRILDLRQLPFSNPAALSQATLGSAVKNRFHDLTAMSRSVLTDVVQGGLKKDLTAWIADTSSTTPRRSSPAVASDDYITPGDPSDTAKYGLPKWELIRSYATTHSTGGAVAPRPQTASQQGISPVLTYARMGYNLTLPPGSGGIYRINVMPTIALWNPYNVPLQASAGSSNTYEFCVKYKPTVFVRPGGVVTFDGVRMKLLFSNHPAPNIQPDVFYLGSIQIQGIEAGPLGPANTFASYAVGTTPRISSSSDPTPVFWRFKVRLSRDLAPGESRLFTISDASDEKQYVAGQSELTDAALGSGNAVFLPSTTPLSAFQQSETARIFWNTEPSIGGTNFSIYPDAAMVEYRLTQPVPAGETNLAVIDAFLSNADNTYQAILGNGFNWRPDTRPVMSASEMYPPFNNGIELAYQRIELLMSSNDDSFVSGFTADDGSFNAGSGTPRWLAQLNPQAAIFLRRSSAATSPDSPSPEVVITPSYSAQRYVKAVDGNPSYPYIPIPDAEGTNVSAGTQIATVGSAQNVVLREFQSAATPLFSLAQLQHANVSLLNLNPAYPIGNSLPNLYVPRTATQSASLPQDAFNTYHPNNTYPGFPGSGTFRHIYDLSYLLNKALWDGFFFSTIPTSLTAAEVLNADYHLPNARHRFYWRDGIANATEFAALKTTDGAAARLLVDGGFNVNSTSEQAWRALLYSHNGLASDPNDSNKKHPFSRLAAPVDPSRPNTPWLGYRILSDAQIDALAKAIVVEVRKRGPFLSLADFVNRRLASDETGLMGPLQAAIEATSGTGAINAIAPFTDNDTRLKVYPTSINLASEPDRTEQQRIFKGSSSTTLPSSSASESRAAFAPGYLTQADLLNAIGPALAARSDTFRIRAYGDVVNPVTGNTSPEARAWCEALVQRMPDYVEATANPASPPVAGSDSETFGRRFKIITFRWLSSDDI
jgi:hypothetical protein